MLLAQDRKFGNYMQSNLRLGCDWCGTVFFRKVYNKQNNWDFCSKKCEHAAKGKFGFGLNGFKSRIKVSQ
jgi:hypothetical protein